MVSMQRTQSCAALNVSQLASDPDFNPVVNQRVRCSAEPWVKASGTTYPVACLCSLSSPMAEAVFSADSTSPGYMNLHFSYAWKAQTPARQSA